MLTIRPLFLVVPAIAAFAATADGALLAGIDFNNATAGLSGALGTFNTTGSAEIFNSTSEIISQASFGLAAGDTTMDLSAIAGTMGGTANNNWGTFAGDLTNAVGADVAGQALSIVGSGNNNSQFTLQVPTTGYEDIVLTYATRGTGTGFTNHSWSWSTDGTNFTALPTIAGRNVTTWSTQTIDLSAETLADNAAHLYFRVTVTGATATGGNNRFDNFQVNGTAIVPEPSSALLLGGVLLLQRRRRA